MYFWLHFTMLTAIVLITIKINYFKPVRETVKKTEEDFINSVSNNDKKIVLKKEL